MNGWLGQAPVKASESPSLGWHFQSARGLYKPPSIRLPLKRMPSLGLGYPALPPAKRMGDDSSFMSPSIGTSFLLLAGGAAGLYFSVVAPPPADSVVKGLGIAAMAWGGYNLVTKFFGGSPPKIDNKTNAEAASIPILSPEAFAKISGQIIFPLPGTVPQVQSDWFVSDYFDIKVVWHNGSDKVANFKYNILAESVSAPGMWIPGQTSLQKIIDDSQVGPIAPGQESGAMPLRVTLFQPPQPGSTAKIYGNKSTYKIYLQLQKIGPSGPEPVGDSVWFGPFDYQ